MGGLTIGDPCKIPKDIQRDAFIYVPPVDPKTEIKNMCCGKSPKHTGKKMVKLTSGSIFSVR